MINKIKSKIPLRIKLAILKVFNVFSCPAVFRTLKCAKRLITLRKKIDFNGQLFSYGQKKTNTFFGYYDISPFNDRNEFVYIEVGNKSKVAKIIIGSIDKKKKVIATTNAWNWQQGARLRWLPGSNDVIAFNDFINGKFVCRFLNIDTLEETVLQVPLYDISANSEYAATIDFSRLGSMRPGYGYNNIEYNKDENILNKGIDILNLNNGTLFRSITFSEIGCLLGLDLNNYRSWYINHLMFSPSGRKMLFFFLKEERDTTSATLLVYNFESNMVSIVENEYKVSHYNWIDDDSIVYTACYVDKTGVNVCRYFNYNIKVQERNIYCDDLLAEDGHPSIVKQDIIITDTYPDKDSYQKIFIVDIKQENKVLFGCVYDRKSNILEKRTDLHPRLSPDRKYVSFDANTSGYRKFYIVEF